MRKLLMERLELGDDVGLSEHDSMRFGGVFVFVCGDVVELGGDENE
jgi:hypothetical protein